MRLRIFEHIEHFFRHDKRSSMSQVVRDSSISFDKIWPWALLYTPRCFDSYLNQCLDIVLTDCTKFPFGTLL